MIKRTLPIAIAIFMMVAFVVKLLSPTAHPDAYEIKGFEFIPQPDDITCGPTSTLMVLRRYHKNPKFEEVERQTKTKWINYKGTPIGMTSPDFIAVALKRFGVQARMEHATLDRLKHYIFARRPCVALLRSGRTTWHYVAVIGYTEKEIITADPGDGRRNVMPIEHFLGAWKFVTDMDGYPMGKPCPLCGGKGRYFGLHWGPLTVCELCEGSGTQPDYLVEVLRVAEVHPMTITVPKESLPEDVGYQR